LAGDIKGAFQLHAPELRRYLDRRLDSAPVAADLVQDAFVRLAEQPKGQVLDLRAYLYSIVRHLLLDHFRQERRRRTFAIAPEHMAAIADDAPGPDRIVAARLDVQRLQAIVGELPLRTQQVFVLTRIDGLTYAAAAKALRISESSVQKHLAMAIQHVTQRLRWR
jgi:RNA polymerase sigma factor (sigma-70 family)